MAAELQVVQDEGLHSAAAVLFIHGRFDGLENSTMKIEELLVDNFRGIRHLHVKGLGDTVIIAGQNGSGKSCIFDAIRLLKSTYGGYQQNEWQHFFGEFAIQLHGGERHLAGLFNDPSRNIEISALFRLRDEERAYISGRAKELLEETIWQSVLPEAFQFGGYRRALFAAQFRDRQPEVMARVEAELPQLKQNLQEEFAAAQIVIQMNGAVQINSSKLLNVAFSNYRPRSIGVIDYHGAQRHYGREAVQGINLNLEAAAQNYSQHSLYNYNNKYTNVKSEMVGNYVKELLAEKAAVKTESDGLSVNETLKELFESFFPDKNFEGPRPTADGSLEFPVKTPLGNEHDLDELSSGEKEILYGYLRIRSSAPRNSIILLDEPELHLNPRLIRGLPEFYKKHLGEALQNQLWLVTHSDALIREAVGRPGFNVFHMLPCGAEGAELSQLRPLTVTADLDVVLADLVGDLAAYRPGGKGLIFEGGGDSDFDKTFVGSLFPDELRGVNLLSGTNKERVKVLHDVLHRAYEQGDLPTKFYAIIDRDSDIFNQSTTPAVKKFSWDVYHIENYLIHSPTMTYVVNATGQNPKLSVDDVDNMLVAAARNVVSSVLIHRMRDHVNTLLFRSIGLGFSPDTLTIGKALHAAAARSSSKISDLISGPLSESALIDEEMRMRQELEESFSDGTWRIKLPGRDVLKQFVQISSLPLSYEVFRNFIVNRMVDTGYKPEGMKNVISAVALD